MYPNPQRTTDYHGVLYKKQAAFQRSFELVTRTLKEKSKIRNAIHNEKVHCPTYKEEQKLLL